MSLIKVLSERRGIDGSNYTVKRNILKCNSGQVNLEGSKAIDNAVFSVKKGYDLEVGDVVSVVMDDVNVDNLKLAYNFYYNLRDESGYNIDGDRIDGSADPVYSVDTDKSTRMLGQKCLDCTGGSQVIKAKTSTSENNTETINFQRGREIQLWFRLPSDANMDDNDKQIIFQRMNSKCGLQVGIQRSYNGKWYGYLKSTMVNGSTANVLETSTYANLLLAASSDDETVHYIRVYSVPDDILGGDYNRTRISVNNKASYIELEHANGHEYEKTVSGDTTYKDIYLCSDSAQTEDMKFRGKLYSVRVYDSPLNGGTSGIGSEVGKIWKRLNPISTMKFAGKIADITSRGSNATIDAVGWSAVLLKTEINYNLFSTGTSNGRGIYYYKQNGSSDANKRETLLENIVGDIITNYNANSIDTTGVNISDGKLGRDVAFEYQYQNPNDEDDSVVTTSQFHVRNLDRYDSGGRFIDTVRLLSALGGKEYNSATPPVLTHLNGADQFFMLPRKVLVFESSDIPTWAYFSTSDGYSITNNLYDDSNLYNDISLFGKLNSFIKQRKQQYNSVTTSTVFDVREHYDDQGSNNQRIYHSLDGVWLLPVSNSDQAEPLVVDRDYSWDGKKITFLKSFSAGGVEIITNYIDISGVGAYYQTKNDYFIKKHGLRSRKFIIPQMEDLTAMAAFTRRMVGAKGDVSKHAELRSPRISNGLGVGMKIKLDDEGSHLLEDFVVKRVTYKFPAMKTFVTLGDHAYDFMDDFKTVTQDIASTANQTTAVY